MVDIITDGFLTVLWRNIFPKFYPPVGHSKAISWDQQKEQDDERKVIMEISSNPINLSLRKTKQILSWGRRQSQNFFNKNLLPMLLLPLLLLLLLVFPVLYG